MEEKRQKNRNKVGQKLKGSIQNINRFFSKFNIKLLCSPAVVSSTSTPCLKKKVSFTTITPCSCNQSCNVTCSTVSKTHPESYFQESEHFHFNSSALNEDFNVAAFQNYKPPIIPLYAAVSMSENTDEVGSLEDPFDNDSCCSGFSGFSETDICKKDSFCSFLDGKNVHINDYLEDSGIVRSFENNSPDQTVKELQKELTKAIPGPSVNARYKSSIRFISGERVPFQDLFEDGQKCIFPHSGTGSSNGDIVTKGCVDKLSVTHDSLESQTSVVSLDLRLLSSDISLENDHDLEAKKRISFLRKLYSNSEDDLLVVSHRRSPEAAIREIENNPCNFLTTPKENEERSISDKKSFLFKGETPTVYNGSALDEYSRKQIQGDMGGIQNNVLEMGVCSYPSSFTLGSSTKRKIGNVHSIEFDGDLEPEFSERLPDVSALTEEYEAAQVRPKYVGGTLEELRKSEDCPISNLVHNSLEENFFQGRGSAEQKSNSNFDNTGYSNSNIPDKGKEVESRIGSHSPRGFSRVAPDIKFNDYNTENICFESVLPCHADYVALEMEPTNTMDDVKNLSEIAKADCFVDEKTNLMVNHFHAQSRNIFSGTIQNDQIRKKVKAIFSSNISLEEKEGVTKCSVTCVDVVESGFHLIFNVSLEEKGSLLKLNATKENILGSRSEATCCHTNENILSVNVGSLNNFHRETVSSLEEISTSLNRHLHQEKLSNRWIVSSLNRELKTSQDLLKPTETTATASSGYPPFATSNISEVTIQGSEDARKSISCANVEKGPASVLKSIELPPFTDSNSPQNCMSSKTRALSLEGNLTKVSAGDCSTSFAMNNAFSVKLREKHIEIYEDQGIVSKYFNTESKPSPEKATTRLIGRKSSCIEKKIQTKNASSNSIGSSVDPLASKKKQLPKVMISETLPSMPKLCPSYKEGSVLFDDIRLPSLSPVLSKMRNSRFEDTMFNQTRDISFAAGEMNITLKGGKHSRARSVIRNVQSGRLSLMQNSLLPERKEKRGRLFESFVGDLLSMQVGSRSINCSYHNLSMRAVSNRRLKKSTGFANKSNLIPLRSTIIGVPCQNTSIVNSNDPFSLLETSIRVEPEREHASTHFREAFGIHNEQFVDRNASKPFKWTARDEVLSRCHQSEPLPFEFFFNESTLRNCQKIGEGVYGEVFSYESMSNEVFVLKIIPIEGDVPVNDEPQKRFHDILSEIVITMELSNLRIGKLNRTNGFTELKRVWCVIGKFPLHLQNLWNEYNERKGSENDDPSVLPSDQLYIVLELSHGGCDYESFFFTNGEEATSVFIQTAFSLAVAESSLQFEHRDLHWGNVLIDRTTDETVKFTLKGKDFEVPSNGVKVTIIDFTLSRLTFEGCSIFNDLAADPGLFTSQGDYQFEIYRMMLRETNNSWKFFHPKTNVFWLHYTLDKLVTVAKYRRPRSRSHRRAIASLKKCLKSTQTFLDSTQLSVSLFSVLYEE